MADKKTATTGIWFDHETGKVVTKKPARAKQLVAPGKTITAAHEALIAQYEPAKSEPKTVTAAHEALIAQYEPAKSEPKTVTAPKSAAKKSD